MKVLHFANLIPNKKGAFELLLRNLGREFQRGGDEFITIFAAEPIPEVGRMFIEAGMRWGLIPGWSEGNGREHPWHFCREAVRLITREKPDLVVVSFGNELPCVVVRCLVLLAGAVRCRWVWIQQQQIRNPGWATRRVSRIRLLGLFFDRLTAVYEGGKQSLLMRGVPVEKISVIYNGSLDSQEAGGDRASLRRELSLPSEAVVAVSTAWLIPRKRIDLLLRAMARVMAGISERGVSLHLLLVGDGPERGRLEDLARELGIEAQVHFLGLRQDVSALLACADLFVLSSLAEACANAISEAMSAGLPAIATEVGAAREQIEDGVTGFVVGRDDLSGLAARLFQVATDRELRVAMGRRARQRWAANFTSGASARGHYMLWRRLMGRPPVCRGRSACRYRGLYVALVSTAFGDLS